MTFGSFLPQSLDSDISLLNLEKEFSPIDVDLYSIEEDSSITALPGRSTSMSFNNDGSRFYTTQVPPNGSVSAPSIKQYDLATNWSVEDNNFGTVADTLPFSILSDGNFISTSSNLLGYPYSLINTATFKDNGSKLFIASRKPTSNSSNRYSGYAVIGRISYDNSNEYYGLSPSSVSYSTHQSREMVEKSYLGNSKGIQFSPDGTKLFSLLSPYDAVYEYPLSTAWDISTVQGLTSQLTITGELSAAGGFRFNDDGSKIFLVGDDSSVYQYNLPTAYSLSGASYSSLSYDFVAEVSTNDIYDIEFVNSGFKMFIASSLGIHEYNLSAAYDLNNITYSGNVNSNIVLTGMRFSSDGKSLYGGYGNFITSYDLSTAYDITSLSTTITLLYIVHTTTVNPQDIEFGDNGKIFYIISNNRISQYPLDQAYYPAEGSVAHTGIISNGFTADVSDDGTKIVILDDAYLNSGVDVVDVPLKILKSYSLDTPWDFTTMKFTGQYLLSGVNDGRVSFNQEGNRIFMTARNYSEYAVARDAEYNNGEISDLTGNGSDFYKREATVNGVRIVAAGTVGGQTAVPDAFIEKVARMFELFTDVNGTGINENAQRTLIKTLSGDAGTWHAEVGATLQRVARGAGADYTPNFLTDQGIIDWDLTELFDTHIANDMVWYLNSTGDGYGVGEIDAQEVIEHVFHTLHMSGLDAPALKIYAQITPDWETGPLYLAMEEAYDAGVWDPSGYGGVAWKTDSDAFETSAKEYLYLLNFSMFEYTGLWDGDSLDPEWSDNMRTPAGILSNNPLGYELFNMYIAPVISKPSLATINSIFGDGNTPAQDDPDQSGTSGYVVDPLTTQTIKILHMSTPFDVTSIYKEDVKGVAETPSGTKAFTIGDNGKRLYYHQNFDYTSSVYHYTTFPELAINNFYRGHKFVPNNNYFRAICNVPTSGEISYLDFYPSNSYSLASSKDSSDEGQSFNVVLTGNGSDGTVLSYSVTGINDSDLSSGSLTGDLTLSSGTATASFALSNDALTEGPEAFTFTIADIGLAPISIVINDTSRQFANNDFSDQTILGTAGTVTSLNGWDIHSDRVLLTGSSRSAIGGFTVPLDTTKPSLAPTNPDTGSSTGTYDYEILTPSDLINGVAAGRSCVRLLLNGTTVSYGIIHGPYVIALDYIEMASGQTVSFDWRAAAGSDAYDVYAYLLKDDGSTQLLLDQTQGSSAGDSGWLNVTANVTATGNYKFVFISGTYDFSGGNAVGASLYVTNISTS